MHHIDLLFVQWATLSGVHSVIVHLLYALLAHIFELAKILNLKILLL